MWDMYRPAEEGGQGLNRHQIAAAMDLSVNNISKTLTIIRRKLGQQKTSADNRMEVKDPDKAQMFVEALSQPNITKEDAAKLLGYKSGDHINQKMFARLCNVYAAPLAEKKRMKLEQLKAILEDQLHRSARFMTDDKLAEASARDLAVAQAAWIEKLQLVKGQPTAIISDHERKQMNELGTALLNEMRRRGITIDGQAQRVAEPPQLPGAP
jgi:hypothetical protein